MIYFISDIHLGLFERSKDRQTEELLMRFLEKIKNDAETLYIVGDLFDYWFEYKSVIPKYFYRTLTKLSELSEAGVKIEYLMGNHDFGHFQFFEEELGIKIEKDDIRREYNGKMFYISHGDGKANNDTGYRILKKILRSGWANFLFRLIHPDFGIKLAHSSSKTSRNYTDTKNYGKSEGLDEFAENKISEGFDFVIMGHRHRLIFKNIRNGVYINLGDWISNPHYAVFDGMEMQLLEVRNLLKN